MEGMSQTCCAGESCTHDTQHISREDPGPQLENCEVVWIRSLALHGTGAPQDVVAENRKLVPVTCGKERRHADQPPLCL